MTIDERDTGMRHPVADGMREGQSGRDYFDRLYRDGLDEEERWLALTAGPKVDSVELLLAGSNSPGTVVELGCGTGSVIEECRKRGIGVRHVAVDYSADATRRLHERTGIEVETADICDWRPGEGIQADLVLLCHVLEHLERPESVLRTVRSFLSDGRLIAEVPLEDLPIARLKALLRDRTRNAAGHVQFFTRQSFVRLLRDSGFEVVAIRQYAPVLASGTIRFWSEKDRVPVRNRIIRYMTFKYLPLVFQFAWCRLWYGHLAVLCEVPADAGDRE
jgi:SAM-dependent methyltransferase